MSLKFVFTYRESARAKSFSKCRSPNAASLGKQLDIRMRESGIGTRIPRSPLLLSVYHFGRTHIQHKIFPWLDQRKWWEVAGRPFRTAMHFESLVGPLKISALGCKFPSGSRVIAQCRLGWLHSQKIQSRGGFGDDTKIVVKWA